MSDENEVQLPIEVEAALELDPKPALKRGFASLRGVKRSTYMRRSLLKILTLSPEERAALVPANGFIEIARNLVNAKGKEGAVAVAVWRECKETLGERIGSNWRETQEHAKGQPTIVCDLPRPDRRREEN